MNLYNIAAVRTNQSFVITNVLFNSFNELEIREDMTLISLFDESSYYTFFGSKEQKNEYNKIEIMLNSGTVVSLYRFYDRNEFIIIFVENIKSQIHLFEELMRVNNTQVNRIRELKKDLQTCSNHREIVDETMRLNNELINVRRELSIQNKRLEKTNFRDSLTKINNRRKFFVDIYAFVKEKDYLLYMLDINNFKLINDELGHKKGDEALIQLAENLFENVNKYGGTVYRLGGDEFSILLPKDSSFDMKQKVSILNELLQ